jgi:hypothetical protein
MLGVRLRAETAYGEASDVAAGFAAGRKNDFHLPLLCERTLTRILSARVGFDRQRRAYSR